MLNIFILNIQIFEFGLPEQVSVRTEVDNFLTQSAGNGVLVQISITTIRRDKM